MKKIILTTLMFSFIGQFIFSQTQTATITGKVTNEKNEPLAGATVRIKGNLSLGTVADQNGKFKIKIGTLPVTIEVSDAESESKEMLVSNTDELNIVLSVKAKTLEAVIVNPSDYRLKGKETEQLTTIETISNRELKNSPLSPYDNLQVKKGVYGTTSSLLFNTYVPRGFNGSGSTRINQRIDGMDNQAPGLNFFVGNFVSNGDLDVENIQLLPGASSALYGPGGMNGTILINSKNPFNPKYQGLSVMVKPGIMHVGNKSPRENSSLYNDYSFRLAKSFNNKFAFKIGAQFISANDWLANDTTNYDRSGTSGKLIGGTRMTDPNYDGVNVYGDETKVNMFGVAQAIQQAYKKGIDEASGHAFPDIVAMLNGLIPNGSSYSDALNIIKALGPLEPTVKELLPFYWGLRNNLIPNLKVSRTGYQEKDIIDPKTKNIKLNAALHYKLTDKIEAQLMGYWATGNTIYTDDNRYALKGIKLGQYKFELKHKNWFLRTYTTQEDAGEAYSATVAAQYFNEAWKKSQQWYPEYVGAFMGAKLQGAPDAQAHLFARGYADIGRPEAGSAQFKQIFDQVRKTPIPNGGLFKEKSQLWMTEGQYSFGDAVKNAEVIVGGNYKKYILNSDGTLFIDTANAININEVGGYAQVTRKLFNEGLTLTAAGRFDKNENFKVQLTPRFAALIKFAKDNNLRMSYQTAYRFPGNLAQWIRLDVGGDYLLLGGLPWVKDYMHVDKNPVHLIDPKTGSIDPNPYVFKEFKPETMRSFEIGYKGIIKERMLVDAYAYFGKYEDFIGRIGLYQPNTGEAYSITINSSNRVKTHGYGLGIDYLLGKKKNSSLFFNVYSDVITNVPSGFKAYFNTPKYRINAGFANSGFGKDHRMSYNLMMRWQDAFQWEGELANGPLNSFTTVDAQVSYKFPKIKSTVRLGGTNILNHYYKNAYGNPQIGGLYYVSYIYNL
jgi:outer membrane receptor protein involved in Fe transport